MSLPVRITSNVTDKMVCCKQSIELTCHADGVDMTEYKWTYTKLNQAKETATIIAIATNNPVEYTCQIIGSDGENGKSSIIIFSNGEPILWCY